MCWCYDEIAAAYSLGAIQAAARWPSDSFRARQRVLYAGVGRGREATLAARNGARVTGIDVSTRMLDRFARALRAANVEAELVCGDVFEHRPTRGYHTVVANFFLNLFGDADLTRAMEHLVSLLEPGGRLVVADFAFPRGGPLSRRLRAAHYRPVNLAAWGLGLCDLHPLYDYAARFETLGLRLVERRGFRPFAAAPELYETLVAERT